jgi:hypothetical protein
MSYRLRKTTHRCLTGALLPAALGLLATVAAGPAHAQNWVNAATNDSINGFNDSGTIYSPDPILGVTRTSAGETFERKVATYASASIGRLGSFATATYKLQLPWGSNISSAAYARSDFGDALTIKGSGDVSVRMGVALHGDWQIIGLEGNPPNGQINANSHLTANWLSTNLGSCGEHEDNLQGKRGTRFFRFTVPAGTKINISSSLTVSVLAGSASTATGNYHNTARVYAVVESEGGSVEADSGHNYGVSANDAYETAYNTPLTVAALDGVLKNDIDTDGSGPLVLSAVLESPPAHGSVTLNPDGSFTYVPNAGFSGTDTFTYKADDGEITANAATVTIKVGEAPVPVNQKPVADAKQVATDEDTAAPVVLSGSDSDGDALSYVVVSQPAHGTLSGNAPNLIYTPSKDWSGTDTFTYKVNDGALDSDPVTVTISVSPKNDAPVAAPDAQAAVSATAVKVAVLGNDTDPDGDALTITGVSKPANGIVSINADGTLTYTSAKGYVGTDTFTYTVSDGKGGTAAATVTMTVSKPRTRR